MKQEKTFEFDKELVRKVKVDVADIPLEVHEVEGTDTVCITVYCEDTKKYDCVLEDGKIKIIFEQKNHTYTLHHFKKQYKSDEYIRIEMPKDMTLEKMKVQVGIGNAKLDMPTVVMGKFKLETGAGTAQIGRLCVQDRVKVEIGAGNTSFSKLVTQETTDIAIECGLGSFEACGNGLGNFDIECGLGNVKISLEQPQKWYNYEVSCALGNVQLNGNRLSSGIAGNYSSTNKEAKNNLHVECGLGSVKIETAE